MAEEQQKKPTLTVADEAGPIDPATFASPVEEIPLEKLRARTPLGRRAVLTPDGGVIFSEQFDEALAKFIRVLEADLRDIGKETTYHTVVGPAVGVVFGKIFEAYKPKPADVPYTLAEFIDRAAQMLSMHPLAMADFTVTMMHRVWQEQASAAPLVGADGQPIKS